MDKKPNSHKNWFHRLKSLSIKSKRHRSDFKSLNYPAVTDTPDINDVAVTKENDTKLSSKSFGRSFRKVQSRVRSCFAKQNSLQNNGGSPNDLPLAPNQPRQSVEETTNTPSPQTSLNSDPIAEDTIPSTDVRFRLINSNWYWGPLSRVEAEQKLQSTCDGTFLVRDSASTNYLFSISFRTLGKTLHTRIDYVQGCYSLYDQSGFPSVYELVENAMVLSKTGVYCYSTSKSDSPQPHYPIRFLKPLSRYTSVPTLRHLCRFVIRQCTNINDLPQLPLPVVLNAYLQEERYI